MNAQAVMTPSARVPVKKASPRAAPAASLAGMRLWKEPVADTPADPHKAGAVARLTEAREPVPAPGPLPASDQTVQGPEGSFDTTDAPLPEAPAAPEAAPVVEQITIAESGLEPHASPYPQRARNDTRRDDSDILGYWARIRGDRAMPAWRDLDQDQIAYFWPNSFLLECRTRGNGSRPIILKATRIVDHDDLADRSADIAFTPPMVSWILGVGIDVIEVESPLDGQHGFPTETGDRETFDVIAMPLSGDGVDIDNVLCHVKRR